MSHGWIILLMLTAQAEPAPPDGSVAHPPLIYTSPQLQPLPSSAVPAEVQLTAAEESPHSASGPQNLDDRIAPLPLAPRGTSSNSDSPLQRSTPTPGGSITTVVSSLAIVLGLLLGVTWLLRRAAPAGSQPLPSDVLQVLGRAMLSPRQQMQLVRIGDKLILIANSPAGMQTLTEITDRAEVERLATACEAARGGSATGTFRQVLSQLESGPTVGGFFGRDEASSARPRQQSRRSGAEVRHA
jgi:flagellar biosynthetic protein FliO